MRIAMVDIETTNLSGDYGIMLCAVVKELGKPHFVFRIDDNKNTDFPDDSDLCLRLRNELEEYDILVTYYGRRFDLPFLNTRLIGQRQRTLKAMKHIDLWFTMRYKLRLTNNRLDTVMRFLDLPISKTKIEGKQCIAAAAGDSEALDWWVKHCVLDVKGLERAYNAVKSQITNIRTT